MKKCWVFLLLCALLLCACGAVPQAEPSPSPVVQEDAEASAPEDGVPLDPAVQEELSALLQQVREEMHIGTAGASLRAVKLASRLLDWAEGAEIGDEQIRLALEPFLGDLDDGIPADFPEQLAAVGGAARMLTRGTSDEAAGMLADAGCEDCGYPWSDKAMETLERILAAAGVPDENTES